MAIRVLYFSHNRKANRRNILAVEAIDDHLTMFLQKVMTTRKHTLNRAAVRFLLLSDVNKNYAVPSCRLGELSRWILYILKTVLYH